MSRRKSVACAAISLGAFTAIAASPATADAQAPRKATLSAVGGMEFKVNRQVADTQRFDRDRVVIRSGGTLTVRNRTGFEHTISLAKRRDLPRNFRQMEGCFGPGGVCGEIAASHGVTDPEAEEQPNLIPRVNVGATGFDTAGDSALFNKEPLKLRITAAKGRSLSYLCIIHPWMQGRISVR